MQSEQFLNICERSLLMWMDSFFWARQSSKGPCSEPVAVMSVELSKRRNAVKNLVYLTNGDRELAEMGEEQIRKVYHASLAAYLYAQKALVLKDISFLFSTIRLWL